MQALAPPSRQGCVHTAEQPRRTDPPCGRLVRMPALLPSSLSQIPGRGIRGRSDVFVKRSSEAGRGAWRRGWWSSPDCERVCGASGAVCLRISADCLCLWLLAVRTGCSTACCPGDPSKTGAKWWCARPFSWVKPYGLFVAQDRGRCVEVRPAHPTTSTHVIRGRAGRLCKQL